MHDALVDWFFVIFALRCRWSVKEIAAFRLPPRRVECRGFGSGAIFIIGVRVVNHSQFFYFYVFSIDSLSGEGGKAPDLWLKGFLSV